MLSANGAASLPANGTCLRLKRSEGGPPVTYLTQTLQASTRQATTDAPDRCARTFYLPTMAATATPEVRPDIHWDEEPDSRTILEPGYRIICRNDPANPV